MKTGSPARRRTLWVAGLVVVALLLGGAVAVAERVLRDRYAVPSADLLGSPTASPAHSPSPTVGVGITGPLNILLVGVDTRVSVPGWPPHADAVLVLHVPAGLRSGYLFSLPRDLLVTVPEFAPAGFGGGRMKLTEAMSTGSRVPGRNEVDPAQGFQLLAATVSRYTGIDDFDAGAVLTFGGMERLVNALNGVDLFIDQRVASLHRQPNGRVRTPAPGGGDYVGPQMVYEPGMRRLVGWQAIDYARQRYLTGGDYARQRHHRQLIRAIVAEATESGLAADPQRLDGVLRALGSTVVFDGRGHSAVDFAYALRGLRPAAITLVGLPGASVGTGGGYQGEQLTPVARQFFAALRAGRVAAFLESRPELVDRR